MILKGTTVVIVVILLLFPLHIIHQDQLSPAKFVSSQVQDRGQVPAGMCIIGQNGSVDTYRTQQNITVPEGSSLEFLNTVVEFLPDSLKNYSINAYGELILVNSSIILEDPMASSITLNIGSNSSGNSTGFLMINSTLDFNGHIRSDNTSLRIYNSTLESPFTSANLSSEDLKYSFSNTHIYSINSSFSGLEVHNQSGEFTAGGLNLNGLPAEKSRSILPVSDWVWKPTALANVIDVALNYSIGNTTTVSNVTFMLFGRDIYTYQIPAREGPEIQVSTRFNISIENTPEYVHVFNSSSNFSIYFQETGYQIILENINITFISNDTVSLLRPDNFGIYLYNSTWLSYDDNFSLNTDPYYIYSYVPDPEKNAIFLEDQSNLYAAGMGLSQDAPGSTPPVYAENGSIAAYFSILSVTQVNQFGDPLRAENNITSSSLSPAIRSMAFSWNRKMEAMLSAFPQYTYLQHEKPGTKVYDLLDTLQNGTGSPEFMGDYGDSTLGYVHYFSLQPLEYFNFTDHLNMTYTDPYPVLNMIVNNMVAGTENSVNISISSMQGSSNLTEIEVMVSNGTSNAGTWTIDPVIVNQGKEFTKSLNISPEKSLHTGLYTITLYAVDNQEFSNKTIWEINTDRVIYSTAGINASLEDVVEANGSISLDVEVHGISPYMKGSAQVIFIVKNQDSTLEEKNNTEFFSGSSSQSFQACFNNTENGTVVESLISLPFPDSGHTSPYVEASSSIAQVSQKNVSLYKVALIGLGISGNDQWRIYNGTSGYASENGTITLNISNGTYFFSVQNPAGFNSTENSVAFTVAGSGLNLDIPFRIIEYSLGIIEEGLPANTSWEAGIGNLTFETRTGLIQVELRPGTYLLNFSSHKFYSSDMKQEWVNITNSSTVIVVHYSYTGGLAGIVEGHPEYISASVVISVFALLYYMDIRRRSFYPCLSCGTTWPRRRRICPGCGRKMNGRNSPKVEENDK